MYVQMQIPKITGLIVTQLGHTSNPLNVSSANPSASDSCPSSLETSFWAQKQQVRLSSTLQDSVHVL